MKSLKKLLSVVLAFAMCAGLAACGTQNSSSTSSSPSSASADSAKQQSRTLKVWLPPYGTADTLDQEFWKNQFKTFEAQHNCKVDLQIIAWADYEAKYLTGITSGQGPDVGYMYMEMVGQYLDMGALEPLDSYFTDAEKANYIYLDKGKVNGKLYMIPFVVGNPRILVCNMDILKKSGFTAPPKTWNDFIACGQKIAKDSPNVYPFLQQWGDPDVSLNAVFYPYLWQTGGDFFSSDGKHLTVNTPQALKAAQFLHDLRYKYKIMPSIVTSLKATDIDADMQAGKAAMAVMSTSGAKNLDKSHINWDFTTSLTDQKSGTFFAADSLVIVNSSKQKDLAADAVKFMTGKDVMSAFHKQLAAEPPITKDEPYNDSPKFQKMYANDSAAFHTLPPIKNASSVMDTLYKNLQLMMLNQLTPEQALKQSADYAETALAK